VRDHLAGPVQEIVAVERGVGQDPVVVEEDHRDVAVPGLQPDLRFQPFASNCCE
jgi:hypothetical protein